MLSRTQKESLESNGYCVQPDVLDASSIAAVRDSLVGAAAESERRGISTYIEGLDPNARNVRVFNLLDLDPVFVDLIAHPVAIDWVTHLLTEDFIISNFTANTALPGSGSMAIHSDLGIVIPEPWHAPWSINIIWCLDDMREENGATRILPGSHKYQRKSELPKNMADKMVPLNATAGSIVAMDGRIWHTSGANRTDTEERALLFGYYTRSFIRPQWNFSASLSAATKARLGPQLRGWLGLGMTANIKPVAIPTDNDGRNS